MNSRNTNSTNPLNSMSNPLMFNNNDMNFGFNNNTYSINNNSPLNPLQNNQNSLNNLNLYENSFQSKLPSNQSLNTGSPMKQIFKNDEITVYVSLNASTENKQVNGAFYVSNNVSKLLNNVKLNLSVKKHIICKVLSTNATSLEPLKSLGIKKVNRSSIFNINIGSCFD